MIASISVFFIVMSIVSFCLKTHPSFRVASLAHQNESVYVTSAGHYQYSIQKFYTEPLRIFWAIEALCNVWFTFEIVLRFIFCPSKKSFVRNPLNIIDFVSLLFLT